MRRVFPAVAAALVAVSSGVACTVPGPDAGLVIGVTMNAVCGGAPPPAGGGGCPVPLHPASDTVTFTRSGAVVARVVSGEDGMFQITLPPGAYLVQASIPSEPIARCEPKTVISPTGPVAEHVTLECVVDVP
jgi:hypothetical protein